MEARTWVDGVVVPCSPDAWAQRRAGFLGCGFRVVLPAGPERIPALARAHDLAGEIATRLGAHLDEAPWRALTQDVATAGALEISGGWTHRFRAPLGACATRVAQAPQPGTAPSGTALPGVILPWRVNEHAPLAGLPAISALHEARALQWLRDRGEGVVGVWLNTAGDLVDTTAGPPLLHIPDGWLHPTAESGTVPHHLWERACADLAATPWRGPAPAHLAHLDVDAVRCVAPDGTVTHLSAMDTTALTA